MPTDPLIGQTLDGRYVIRSRIARGGMAMVYLANDLRLERRVAVKVMHEHLAEDENFTRRFEQEARSAARLSHPNLVNVFDQGHDFGRTYLVMEYLPSITLRDLLKQQKRLTTEQSLEIGEAILGGLAAAHHAGIVHRDLKPENVMLADDGRIKLGDFGLARAVSANTTTGQALLGTIAYLSPELVTRGVADARSDLYAFGIMMYEMLTGVQPFTGEQPMQIAYQHAHSEVPVPSLISSEATPELDELVRWTTQREPEDRPTDAGDALKHLAALRSGATPAGATRVLAFSDMTDSALTPSTTVLDGAQQEALAHTVQQEALAKQASDVTHTGDSQSQPPATSVDRASTHNTRRKKRGRLLAILFVVLILLAGGIGWWFGQGPGSQVSVPRVEGSTIEEAQALLAEHSIQSDVIECSSLEVPAGEAVSTDPGAGTRLDRGSTVALCQSTGPEILPVPMLVGLALEQATAEIKKADFTFGSVLEERFSDAESGVVLAALGQNDEPLGETYPQQGRIDLIVSAGSIPDVAGMPESEATSTLADHELTVDPALGSGAHNNDVPEGSVISLVLNTDPVKPGDSVGLQVSLGPELFPIPDVAGLTVREAKTTIESAGFTAEVSAFELLWDTATITRSEPEAGSMLALGSTVTLRYQLFG